MPLQRCQSAGRPGWKWGESGKCYPGPAGKSRAWAQGKAIKSSQGRVDTAEEKQRMIRLRREMVKVTGVRLPRPRKIPPKQYRGIMIEVAYFAAIMRLIEPLFVIVREKLIPHLSEFVSRYSEQVRVDQTYGEIITKKFGEVEFAVHEEIFEDKIQQTTETFANRTSNFNRTQVNKQFFSVLGINPLRTEPYLASLMAAFTETNVALIKTLPAQFFQRIETGVRAAVEQGASTESLTRTIMDEFGSVRSRSKLIARDQIGKFNGKLTELRQREVGVTHYFWDTSEDERVRPALKLSIKATARVVSHRVLHGKRFAWNKPPVSGTRGQRLHPGQPIQCRCVPIPDMTPFKTEIIMDGYIPI